MGQILAIDYGKKRCGLAATDDMQIIASGLETVPTESLMAFLERYHKEHTIERFVVGLPRDLRGEMSQVEEDILPLIEKLKTTFPSVPVERFDERFTSKIASYYISQSGKNKKQREKKELIDKVSATLILQNYLDTIR